MENLDVLMREIANAVEDARFDRAKGLIDDLLGVENDHPVALGYLAVVQLRSNARVTGSVTMKRAQEAFETKIESESDDSRKRLWEKLRSSIIHTLFQLASGSDSEVLSLARLILEEVGVQHERAYLALALDFAQTYRQSISAPDPQKSLLNDSITLLNKAIEIEPQYASAWYNLACAHALLHQKVEMLETLKKAIDLGRTLYEVDYRVTIREDSDFDDYKQDPEFNQLVNPLPDDPFLRSLYSLLRDGALDQVLIMGQTAREKLPPHSSDLLGTLEAMHEAARRVLLDVDENGEFMTGNYGLEPRKYKGILDTLAVEIENLQDSGIQSDAMKVFRGE